MRVLKSARTALERQVWESVYIDRLSGKEEACLNLKSEWGLSQTPSLQNKIKVRSRVPQTPRDSGQKRGEAGKETQEEGGIRTGADHQPPAKRKKTEEPGDFGSQ